MVDKNPLLMHYSYVFFALTHQYQLGPQRREVLSQSWPFFPVNNVYHIYVGILRNFQTHSLDQKYFIAVEISPAFVL